jgi:hypothetical protein
MIDTDTTTEVVELEPSASSATVEKLIRFLVEDLERRLWWYQAGETVYVNTHDEALMRVLHEFGASASAFKPEAHSHPELTAWEVNLTWIAPGIKQTAKRALVGQLPESDTSDLHRRVDEMRELLIIEREQWERKRRRIKARAGWARLERVVALARSAR